MKWRILGPVEGEQIGLLRPQQRGVLSFLLLNAGRVVTIEQLIEALWADRSPGSARTQVHICVSQIRQALRGTSGEGTLSSQLGGYQMTLCNDDDLDLADFTRRAARAHTAKADGRLAAAADELRNALALWRGAALTGATGAFVPAAAAALQDKRLAAYEELADVELALGRYAILVIELQSLVWAHPLRERLIGQLMLALAGCGQQAQALDLFTATRARLAEALGVSPSADLTSAHLRVLRQELSDPPGPPAPFAVVTPAQLPADVVGFAGRASHLHQLDELLDNGEHRGCVVISAIDGTAGVGKTALAIHWAHRVAHRFPDGQLYANLRGFDPTRAPMPPAEAIRGFLDALDLPPRRLPASLDAQAGLYRSLLAGKRMLMVLDNARDTAQVMPLLPGTGGCLVIVTSRNRLTGLIATTAARPLTLDLLSTLEAADLVAQRIGRSRLCAEPGAAHEIIERCARLPLALAVAAARAATEPELSLAALAQQLREAMSTLDTADPATDVRTAFSWSYRALSPGAATAFRLLGLHPGPDVAAPAIASLAGQPLGQVRPLVAELASANLASEPAPGRHGVHDLLRAYAADLALQHDDERSRRAALERLLDHYLHTAHTAAMLLDPHRVPIMLAPARPGVTLEELADRRYAHAWFTSERPALLAAIQAAADADLHTHAWQLAWTLTDHLDRQGRYHDLAAINRVALATTQRRADRLGQAWAHRGIGLANVQLGYPDPHTDLRCALELFGEVDDLAGQASTHHLLAWACEREHSNEEALCHARDSLRLYQSAGHLPGQAAALNNIGWYQAHLGAYQEAFACCERALALHQQTGDRPGQAATWDSLGFAHHHVGHYRQATACYQHALDLFSDIGDRYEQAATLDHLGDTQQATGDVDTARHTWAQSLDILTDIGHPAAARIRAKLHQAE